VNDIYSSEARNEAQELRTLYFTSLNRATKKEVWARVFQVVSDNPQMLTREVIKKLEAVRDEDGAGPS
jgi:hypothetical protein